MADLKITELNAATTLVDADLLTAVTDVATTAVNKKITWTNAQGAMTKVGKVTVTQPATGSTLTVAEGSTLATSGAYSTTLTATGATNVTLPTTGTLATLAGAETLTNKVAITSATVNATTFDTNVAAAGVTLVGVTLSADGTDGAIDINITPKGTGEVNITKVDIDAGTIDGATIATSDITVGSGKTLNVSAGTLTTAAGQIQATSLQNAAADLGAADVNVNLGNTNGAYNTNLTIDGTLQAGSVGVTGTRVANGFFTDLAATNTITGSVSGNAATVTTNANLTGIVTSVGNATAIASGAITADKLQAAASDLGAADVNVNLGNTNGAFNTNLTIDGTLQAGSVGVTGTRVSNGFFADLAVTNTITGSISGNAATVTTNANLTGIVTSTGNATAIAAGAIPANRLQASAADLGAADVTIDLGNTNSTYVTNLTTDGTITASVGFSGAHNGTVGATTPSTIVGTTITANTGLLPDANDGAYIGNGTTAFSDLFLADGGVINWNNGNATLTHSTGLLTSNVPVSLGTSNAMTVGTIELGAASDTTLSRNAAGVLQVEGVVIPSISSTNTLTNKRITKRVTTTTDDATAVIDIDACDVYQLSAVANATEFTTTGTPTDGQMLIIRLKDAGVAKGLTWTGFTAIGVTLPTTTVASKWHYIGCTYNSAASAWHAIAVQQEA